MLLMSRSNFLRARAYLFDYGRPLEQELFRYHFEGGSPQAVLAILQQHQSEDGGFAAMGEGDANCSSPIGTCVAFQILSDLHVPVENELVQKGIPYFLRSFDDNRKYWFPDLSRKDPSDHEFDYLWGNPSAEIIGYLHEYKELVPVHFLEELTDIAVNNLRCSPRPLEMFATLCFLRMAQRVPRRISLEILNDLRREIRTVVNLDPSTWTGYFAKPVWYAPLPLSPLYNDLEHETELNLDDEISRQSPEGFFPLNWDADTDEVGTWRSILTLETLVILRNHGRIEGVTV